jgi:N12 class adenine-specific DNA methylase
VTTVEQVIEDIETKGLPEGQSAVDLTGVIGHDDVEGTVTAIVAVTGVKDEVDDVFVPGVITKSLSRIKPKGVDAHDWKVPVSKAEVAEELYPGDPRLPAKTADGALWPKNAGGMLIKARYNLKTPAGLAAYENAKFYGLEQSFSVGYKVRPGGAKQRNGVRYIHDADIYEYSQVLHGAHRLAQLVAVKSLSESVSDPWYDESRSGATDEGTFMLTDGMESKSLRVVRKPEFWGLPVGTVIRAGMKPHGLGRAATPAEIAATTAPGGDSDSLGPGSPKPGQGPSKPGALGGKPGAAPEAPVAPLGPGVAPAMAALHARYQAFAERNGDPTASAAMRMITEFARPGADVHASPDGQLAAINTPGGWVIVDTANAANSMPPVPADVPADQIDAALARLADIGIPWSDVDARRKRWAKQGARAKDQAAVRDVLAQLTPFTTPTPEAGPGSAGAARGEVETALAAHDRAGLLDALMAMDLPEGEDPYELSARLMALPSEEATRRLDALTNAASPLTGDPSIPTPNAPAVPGAAPGVQRPTPGVAGSAAETPGTAALDPKVPVAPAEPLDDRIFGDPVFANPYNGKPGSYPTVKAGEVRVGDHVMFNRHDGGKVVSIKPGRKGQSIIIYDDGMGGDTSTRQVRNSVPLPLITAGAPPADPAAVTPPEPDEYTPTGDMNAPEKLDDAQLEAEHQAAIKRFRDARAANLPTNSVAHHDAKLAMTVFGDEKRRRTTAATAPAGEPATPDAKPGSSVVAAYRANKMSVEDFQSVVAKSPETRRAMLAEMGVDEVESLLEPSFLSGDREYRDQVIARLAEIDPSLAAGPKRAAAKRDRAADESADTVPIPADTADAAAKVRDAALGIEESPDGELLLTEDAATRQDRVEKLLEAGAAALKGESADKLGEHRRDLVDELALQNELHRRETERRKEAAAGGAQAGSARAGEPGSEIPDDGAPEDTGPKLRPGIAGAAEDLGDALNATPRDDDATAAAERFAKMLRRHGDSPAFDDIRKTIGDNIHVAIARGDLKAGMLFTAAAALREERRTKRNTAARARRVAKRIERDRIRSLIGAVDIELRSRGVNPEDYGGAVDGVPRNVEASTPAPPESSASTTAPPATPAPVRELAPAGSPGDIREQRAPRKPAQGAQSPHGDRPGERDGAADTAGGRPARRTGPAERDLPTQGGAPAGSGPGSPGTGVPGDGGTEQPRETRPSRVPDRTGEPGGLGTGEGDGGLPGRSERTGQPEPDQRLESPADAAEQETDLGDVAQPRPERGALEAIPDTGESFRPTDTSDFAPAGKRAKLDANLAALRVLRELQTDNRPATSDEQAVLARWSGWGGLPEVFDDTKPEYETERNELRGLLSESEWNEARRNTLNAHYTDARVVQSLWKAVSDLGFDGGRVLEPGSGSGTFIGFAPDSAELVGVELDSTTAAISRALYPHATIRNESFADTRIPSGSFDATIGNVPFGKFALQDRVHNPGRKESIHNHFILKSLALTKPGGLCTVLTSRYTLDAQNKNARKKMAEMGDLIGAVRLPTGSHSKTSGTDVIEDILIFRRREPGAEPLTPQDWVNSTKRDINGFQLPVSDYFTNHPEQVLGELTAEKGQYGTGSLIVKGDTDMAGLPAALERITTAARENGITASPRLEGAPEFTTPDASRHDGHIAAHDDGSFSQAAQGTSVPLEVPERHAEALRGLIGMRDTLRSLLSLESTSVTNSAEIRDLRRTLNEQYDAYVGRYGPINAYTLTKSGTRKPDPVKSLFRRDPMSAIVRALEVYDPETGTARKTDIFVKRSVSPREIPTHADNPTDALALCMDTYGEVRLDAIANMLGTDTDDARAQLDGLIFEQPPLTTAETDAAFAAHIEAASEIGGDGRFGGVNPRLNTTGGDTANLDTVGESVRAAGTLEPAAAYLSGNVRRKLAAAREAAKHDGRFEANVKALEAVIPADLGIDEVDGRLGAAWIPAEDVRQFLVDLIHDGDDSYGSIKVSTSGGGIWTVTGAQHGTKATEEWGTDRISAGEIVQKLLEQRSIRIMDTIDKKSYPNLEATTAAQAKADELQDRFSEWLWEDPARTQRLLAAYNNQFNALRLRTYDDIERTFPGMSDTFAPFGHQVAAVNRMVAEPAALLAHVVGAGKTAEMAMGTAELKRLGLARKPAIVVPNHMLEQFSREYLEIYPNAKVLAAGSEDLEGDKRREFVARAATGDWDCVILTQKAMQAIPMSREAMAAYIDREMSTMRAQLERAREDAIGDDNKQKTLKKMEQAVLSAEEALKAKLDKTKDAGVTWEQTGIDYVCVDEAHQYSNLRTISNIQGAGATGSDMASDLHMKLEHLRANSDSGRVVTFASGTPIRNTVTQAYIMQKFLRPDLLEEAGIHSFDQWAATFGKVVDEMELKPEGTGFRQTTRFAKFRNVPELLRLFHMFADVKMADDLNLKTPDLETGAVQNVVVPASDELKEFMASLSERAENYRNGHPDKRPSATGGEDVDDMMLLISMDGRKAAMSMSSKLDMAADRITGIWQKTKDRPVPKDINDPLSGDDPPPGGMQIVFCDLFTPGGKDMDAYAALRNKLAARGMDPSTIRFMHEAKNDREKAELFAAARNGQVSVLIGSTEKMGVGTNVQRRAVALHHLDSPWRPSDVEQRDGRIMRQGNVNKEVAIYRYVTEGSFDAYMWQTLERKKKFIDQIMRGKLGDIREIEDVGETALSYAEVKALATGNPLLLDKAKVDVTVGKLSRLERQCQRTQTNLRKDVVAYGANAEQADEDAARYTAAIAKRTDTTGDKFSLVIHGNRYTDRAAAVEHLRTAIEDRVDSAYGWDADKPKYLGTFGGHDLMGAVHRGYDKNGRRYANIALSWDGLPGTIEMMDPARVKGFGPGVFTSLTNSLAGLESRRDIMTDRAQSYRDEAEQMKKRIGVPFAHADALKAARDEAERLSMAMEAAGLSSTGAAAGPGKDVETARARATRSVAYMGRGSTPAKEVLKRFANPAAAGHSYAAAGGALAAMGSGADLKVFVTADGVSLRPRDFPTDGQVDNPQALLDDLAALDLPWEKGYQEFNRLWYGYDNTPEDYSLSFEQRTAAREARRKAKQEKAERDQAAIKAVWERHLVRNTAEVKSALSEIIHAADLARWQEIKDSSKPAEDEEQESYEDTVDADVRYFMDAGGVLQKVEPCPKCDGEIQSAVFGNEGDPRCPSCGAKPASVAVG